MKPKVTQSKSKTNGARLDTKLDKPKRPVRRASIKKKEFLEKAVEASGVKKKDAKPAIDAAFRLICDALIAGEELSLPPLGKLKVNRSKDLPNAKVLILKLRVPNGMSPGSTTDVAATTVHLNKT